MIPFTNDSSIHNWSGHSLCSRRVLLLSNPGTGKSVFQFYLLARYLNPSLFTNAPLSGEIQFGSEKAPKVVIRHTPLERMEVWFLEQQIVRMCCGASIRTQHCTFSSPENQTTSNRSRTSFAIPYPQLQLFLPIEVVTTSTSSCVNDVHASVHRGRTVGDWT